MNNRHRTIKRWYKRHKQRTFAETMALVKLYVSDYHRLAKELTWRKTKSGLEIRADKLTAGAMPANQDAIVFEAKLEGREGSETQEGKGR